MTFRVGLTRDFLGADGTLTCGDIGLSRLSRVPGLEWEFLPEHASELTPELVQPYDAVMVMAPRVTAATVRDPGRLALIARFGVGYDNVDPDALTRQGVLLTITPDGVRRPVAVAAMTFLLALSQRLLEKDRLTRSGRWAEKLAYMGMGLTGRTLGIVGFGNIGRELGKLASPFGLRVVAHDPNQNDETIWQGGAEPLSLSELFQTSDFVCLCCALTDATRHLVGAELLGMMRSTSYLINVARGPVVDQSALLEVLQQRRIAGAGLDVFETEPIASDDPILRLENVIVAPHALCWTDECFLGIGNSAITSILDIASGRIPRYSVNPEAADHPRLRERLADRSAREVST